MKKLSYLIGVCFALLLIVNGCNDEPARFGGGAGCGGCTDPLPGGGGFGQPPTISSFSPQKGFAGTRVTIVGTKFSATPAYNIVTFDGQQAQVVSATTTSLNVIAPANVTTGKVNVSVSGLSATSASDFQVLDIPLGGLAAFYPCDGNASDASVNQNHGAVIGATPAADRDGNPGRSFYLDGNDYLNMGNPPSLQFGNEITVSIWVNLQTSGGMIFNKKNPGGTSPGYVFDYATNAFRTYGGFRVFPNAPACQNYYSFTLTTQTWMSLTVTLSGSQSKYYQNGVLIGTNAGQCPLPVTSEGNFLVGNAVLLGWGYLTGYVDDIAIYNRALSDAEVATLHQQPILP
jgi:hypothetical protein